MGGCLIMAERFARHLLLAAVIFVVMSALVYSNKELDLPETEYISYVVTTDLSLQTIHDRMTLAEKQPQRQSCLKGRTEATSVW